MGTFAGKTKINRAVADPNTDHTLPPPAALSWGGITSASGIAGTTGTDAKLVHGDRWEQIDGSFTETTNLNVKTMILGNETRQVTGTRTLTSIGNVTSTMASNMNETVVGSTIRTNIGAAAHTYVSNHVQTHCSPQNLNEPGIFMRFVSTFIENVINKDNIAVAYKQIYVFYFTLTPVYINITPTLNFAATTFNIHFEGFDNASRGLENKLMALKSDIGALEGKLEFTNFGTMLEIGLLKLAINSIAF